MGTTARNKTHPTGASVDVYLAAIEDERRRLDCQVLVELFSTVTKCPPVLWGPSIVGFGAYRYRYESGREGDACATGFASRKGDISIYLMAGFPGQDELLAALGKHRMGRACLYIRRLSEIDTAVLAQLIAGSVAEVKRRHAFSRGAPGAEEQSSVRSASSASRRRAP